MMKEQKKEKKRLFLENDLARVNMNEAATGQPETVSLMFGMFRRALVSF